MNGVLPARIALIPELLERAAADWPDRTALVCGERRIDYRRYAAEVRGGATPATGAAAGRARGHPARQLRPGLRADAGIANGRLPARAAQSALYRARTGFHPARRPTRAADRRRGLVRPGRAAGRRARHPPARWRGGARLDDSIRRNAGGRAGRRRGRAGAAAIHRRHHRPAQGRHPEPGRHRHQCVPARSRAAHAPRRRDGALRHAAVPFLRHGDGVVPGGQRRRHAGGAAALPARRCVRRRGARARHAVPRQPDDLCRPDGACALRADRLVQRARLLFGLRATGRGNAAALGGRGGRADL